MPDACTYDDEAQSDSAHTQDAEAARGASEEAEGAVQARIRAMITRRDYVAAADDQVGDADTSATRQRPVSGEHYVRSEPLASGGAPARARSRTRNAPLAAVSWADAESSA